MSDIIYKEGSRGAVVKKIQELLHLYPDGVFGPVTAEAVRDFQREHGLKADGIAGPATLSRMFPSTSAAASGIRKSRRRITEIIVHCTATPEGKDFTVNQIRQWHKARGFSDIGYHYVIYRDGSVNNGRNVDFAGAHTLNHNAHSIGVSYVGGVADDGKTPKDTRTKAQRESLLSLLRKLKAAYPNATIHGHRDFANKACPSFDAAGEYKNI